MQALGLFTNRGLGRLIDEGGSQAWKLKPERVKKLTYVVCAQNKNDGEWGQPTHVQGEGFVIARIRDVMPSPERRPNRYIVLFDEYAEISVPKMAHRWRNPVQYIELDDYGIDPNKLTFTKMLNSPAQGPNTNYEPSPRVAQATSGQPQPMDMKAAKQALAAFYKVPVDAVEITIRG
jgi:hypothetical protein